MRWALIINCWSYLGDLKDKVRSFMGFWKSIFVGVEPGQVRYEYNPQTYLQGRVRGSSLLGVYFGGSSVSRSVDHRIQLSEVGKESGWLFLWILGMSWFY